MRIMVVSATAMPIPAYKGGATETLVTQLLNKIQPSDDLSIDVFSNCGKEADYSGGNEYIKYHYVAASALDRLYTLFFRVLRLLLLKKTNIPSAFARRLCKTVDLNRYDAILMEGDKNQVNIFRRRFRKTLILHIHTVMTFTKDTPFAKKIFDNCDYVLANSLYTQRIISEIDINRKDKVIALPNCIDLSAFKLQNRSEVRNEIRKKYNIDDSDFVYIYCGRIEPGKGVKELIRAFAECGSNAKLMIVGASWYDSDKKTKYVKEIIELSKGLEDRIVFTGYIPHCEIAKYYLAADICVVPSIYAEAACLVVLEAQACGLRVIASNIGGIPEFTFKNSSVLIKTDGEFVKKLSEEMLNAQTSEYNAEMDNGLQSFLKAHDTEQYYVNFKSFLKNIEGNCYE